MIRAAALVVRLALTMFAVAYVAAMVGGIANSRAGHVPPGHVQSTPRANPLEP